jgi:hypothetical protein
MKYINVNYSVSSLSLCIINQKNQIFSFIIIPTGILLFFLDTGWDYYNFNFKKMHTTNSKIFLPNFTLVIYIFLDSIRALFFKSSQKGHLFEVYNTRNFYIQNKLII